MENFIHIEESILHYNKMQAEFIYVIFKSMEIILCYVMCLDQ